LKLILPLALVVGSAAAQSSNATPAVPQTGLKTQDQVTVTANRSAIPIGDTAKTTSTLNAEDLHQFPAVTLDESLDQHAGFELFRRASSRIANPTSDGISLRGLGSTAASRTLVLEDGAPLNDPFGGWINWAEPPGPDVQAVEIVTGGGSDLYGSSALGGVVDVYPAAPAPTRFELSAAGGAQDTSDLTALGSKTSRLLSVLGAGESLRTAGYIVTAPQFAGPVDTPANVRSQAYHVEVGRRNLAPAKVFLTGNLLNQDHHNGTPLQTNATRLWRYLLGYDLPETGLVSGRIRAFGSQEGYRQSFSSIDSARTAETLTRLQRVHTQELGATGDATVRLGPAAAVFGADYRDIRGEDDETPIANNLPSGIADVTARQRFFGGFGELLAQRKAWSGAASLRADRASNLDIVQDTNGVLSSQPNRTEIVLSPRAGVVRSFGPAYQLHASGFRAFRTPTMNELYRTGQVGQQITLANPALNSERATGYEVGAQLAPASARTTLQATYFWTQINRPVSAVTIAQTATTLTQMRENLGQIRSRGLELAATAKPARSLSATIGYQYAVATVTRFSAQPSLVGNWIPEVPRQSFTAQLRAQSAHLGEVTLAARTTGLTFDDSANQYPLAGFYEVDVSGSRALSRRLSVNFLLQNITNQRAQVSRTPILTLGSPIYGEAGLRWALGRP
jgi:outer membrane receptor protein involved in Fe transport